MLLCHKPAISLDPFGERLHPPSKNDDVKNGRQVLQRVAAVKFSLERPEAKLAEGGGKCHGHAMARTGFLVI